MLDGAARVDELVAAAVADGQRALGITDHGNLYGRHRLLRGLPRGRGDADPRPRGLHGGRLALRAARRAGARSTTPAATPRAAEALPPPDVARGQSNEGYRNLRELSLDGVPRGLLLQAPRRLGAARALRTRGSIATTGCLGGVVLQALLAGDYARRASWPRACRASSGARTSTSSSRTTAWPSRRAPTPSSCASPRDLGAPLLATNDLHYVHHGDAEMHDALLCVGTGSLVADPNRFRFHCDQHYLKSAAEMRHLFARRCPRRATTRSPIAERADGDHRVRQRRAARVPAARGRPRAGPHKEAASAYLRDLAYAGAAERYGDPLPASRGRAARLRARRHRRHGLLGLLPRGLGPDPPRARAAASASARAAGRRPAAASPTA